MDETERDWTETVLGLKIVMITAQEQNMRLINTVPNELELYLLFKTGLNRSYFFCFICTIKSHSFLLKLVFHKNLVESRVFAL